MIKSMYKKLDQVFDDTIENIMDVEDKNHLGNVLWESIYENNIKCKAKCGKGIKIVILNAPCNGFGDLIFALKLSNYLKEWYDADVTIVTSLEQGLLDLGADNKHVAGLTSKGKISQCRRFKHLKINKELPVQDLILIAPVQADYDADLTDVKHLIPYANKLNTFSFSEYNDTLDKNFTFNTGVGKERDGILLTKTNKKDFTRLNIQNPYALIYVASTLDNVDKCILGFVEMVASKYHKKHKNFDIVVPDWFSRDININKKLRKNVSNFYPNILIKIKDEEKDQYKIVSEGYPDENTLTFRCDILPVNNNSMIQLMKNSVDDILLTGDQSISDAFSCCYKKNIFYQIAPWKSDLAKELAKEMPNSFLRHVKTSCGTLKAVKYRSNYGKFVKKWDFRKRSKAKMDAIILSIIAMKISEDILKLADMIINTRTLKSLQKKLYAY